MSTAEEIRREAGKKLAQANALERKAKLQQREAGKLLASAQKVDCNKAKTQETKTNAKTKVKTNDKSKNNTTIKVK